MQYRADLKTGKKLSIMGFGCMRFPRNLNDIDMDKTEQLIVKAVQDGVNYFDTAYSYEGSEAALGQILAKNDLRGKIFLATKMPLDKCGSYDDFDFLFNEQLQRLQTGYIDYYLFHNLFDVNLWEKLCVLGIEEWIKNKKESGKIKNIGFSFHGIHEEFIKLLNMYNWDFCQIQYNYININYQAGMGGLKEAAKKGLPVIIMEPLLGGKLATGLPKKAAAVFKEANSSLSPAAWALRWLWNQNEVTVVLSGMNDITQLEDNLNTAQDAAPHMLSKAETDAYESVIKIVEDSYKIPCTGCNYCQPCPQNVNIGACFAAYNVSFAMGKVVGFLQYVTGAGAMDTANNRSASECKECGACEQKCPQHIPIIQSLKDVNERMEPFFDIYADFTAS